MHNWNTDTSELQKDKEKYSIWKLEQGINYGLDGEKLDKSLVKKYWSRLQLDPAAKNYLKLLLWPKKRKFSPKSR
jgi:hypothetical protein